MSNLLDSLHFLSEYCPENKYVLVRVDFNVPVKREASDSISVLDHSRISAHKETITKLVVNKNKVVLISHQGRPGTSDFTELRLHSELASRIYGINVQWVPDVAGPYALNKIRNMRGGEVILLDNIRLYSEELIEATPETHAKSILVQRLSSVFDYYVNDAFATAHRSHASIVGFPYVLPSLVGILMERELRAISKIFDPEIAPKVFVLGGGKVYDTLRIIENLFKNRVAERILTGGLVAELFLIAKGIELGPVNRELLETRGILSLVPRARKLLLRGAPIETPVDFVTLKGGQVLYEPITRIEGLIRDIGPKTLDMYRELVREAGLVVLRGPLGVIEDPLFRKGTLGVIESALKTSSFTILGGGHMNALLAELDIDKNKMHISTGGAALLTLLSGEPMPALLALKLSAEKFSRGVKE